MTDADESTSADGTSRKILSYTWKSGPITTTPVESLIFLWPPHPMTLNLLSTLSLSLLFMFFLKQSSTPSGHRRVFDGVVDSRHNSNSFPDSTKSAKSPVLTDPCLPVIATPNMENGQVLLIHLFITDAPLFSRAINVPKFIYPMITYRSADRCWRFSLIYLFSRFENIGKVGCRT